MNRLILAFTFGFVFVLCAGVGHSAESKPYATVTVKGMVCSFCVQGVEKKLLNLKHVQKVTVDLEKKTVSIWVVKDGTVADNDIREAIRSAGYNIEAIQRSTSIPLQKPEGGPKTQGALVQ